MIIDNEFKNLIPALSGEEFTTLEKNIIKDGCRDPLVLWGDTLVDGHNRHAICEKHNIGFKTVSIEFTDKVAAKVWMLDNAFGQRNMDELTKYENRSAKRALLAEVGKKKQGQRTDLIDSNLLPIMGKKSHNTQTEIANDLGWSHSKLARTDVVIKKAKPEQIAQIKQGETTVNRVYQKIRAEEKQCTIEDKKEEYTRLSVESVVDNKPIIYKTDCMDYMINMTCDSVDLLFTDPPYSTDIEDIESFARSWLHIAIDKVKTTGRAYICIGAYPLELMAYLTILLNEQDKFIVDNPLIWAYKNTLGITPKMKYNLNYQAILHLYTKNSKELDSSITNEMFSVQEINAPDGRLGDRYHTWQKPEKLALQLINHSTVEGDVIFDPFACTGTFLIAGAKLKRNCFGCEVDTNNLNIALERGCVLG